VRDLTWSRHQLEELANRRFVAAQRVARAAEADAEGVAPVAHLGTDDDPGTTFADLFRREHAGCCCPGAGGGFQQLHRQAVDAPGAGEHSTLVAPAANILCRALCARD